MGHGAHTQKGPEKQPQATRARSQTHAEPTAGAPATIDGKELGAEGEEHIAKEDAAAEGGPLSESSGGASSSNQNPRGPDQYQRERRTWKDQGDNPERPHDWSDFDIGRVVRIFRTNRESAIRLSLRKLHVRWWHAQADTMKRFLDRVGVAQKVLDLIPDTVATCSVCRARAKA